jgi:hypothetical protein
MTWYNIIKSLLLIKLYNVESMGFQTSVKKMRLTGAINDKNDKGGRELQKYKEPGHWSFPAHTRLHGAFVCLGGPLWVQADNVLVLLRHNTVNSRLEGSQPVRQRCDINP